MLKRILINLINRYQAHGGGNALLVDCNFEPTCSEYAKQAISRYGTWQGVKLGFNRIKRCNCPDLAHRISDPVPQVLDKKG